MRTAIRAEELSLGFQRINAMQEQIIILNRIRQKHKDLKHIKQIVTNHIFEELMFA